MPAADQQPKMPAQGVRTAISLLLMLHFVFIAIAVSSNFSPVSSLRYRLRNVPFSTHYAQLLMQDAQYNGPMCNFAITDGPGFNLDHHCRILLDWQPGIDDDPAAQDALERISLVPEGVWPATRRNRYLQLGMAVAVNSGTQVESLLPDAITNHLLRAAEGDPAGSAVHRFQCVGRLPLSMGQMSAAGSDPLDDTWLLPRYQADVIGTGQRWALNRVGDRLDVTQVEPQDEQPRRPAEEPNRTPPGGDR